MTAATIEYLDYHNRFKAAVCQIFANQGRLLQIQAHLVPVHTMKDEEKEFWDKSNGTDWKKDEWRV